MVKFHVTGNKVSFLFGLMTIDGSPQFSKHQQDTPPKIEQSPQQEDPQEVHNRFKGLAAKAKSLCAQGQVKDGLEYYKKAYKVQKHPKVAERIKKIQVCILFELNLSFNDFLWNVISFLYCTSMLVCKMQEVLLNLYQHFCFVICTFPLLHSDTDVT